MNDTLCTLADIADGCAMAVQVDDNTQYVVVRRGSDAWAYLNRCPHFSIPLDFEPGVFCTYDANTLMCAHHSAMFRFEDGLCVDGPCQGAALTKVDVVVLDGHVVRRPCGQADAAGPRPVTAPAIGNPP
ncbi:MAG TPA: Rieske 2Fe-2S domain-containing protein [Pararobbsia sp.]|nr:Rieske 2Fe-2S domain-containing protein [Pararobbsia sp.]